TFNLLNSEIAVSTNGTGFLAKNVTGNLFGTLVDTAATQVMYSVRNAKVDTFYYRVGANNLLPGVVPRYASLYFKRFLYPSTGVLSVNSLSDFKGVSQKQTAVLLITDMAGQIVKHLLRALKDGNNSLILSGIDKLQKGNYIVSVNTGSQKLSSQIIVQ